MSSIDLLILGIVLEGPISAYDIQKDVEYHHFSRWTRVSIPSVYKKVLQLREQGYLDSSPAPGKRAGEKSIYTVTDKGRDYFLRLMEEQAARPVPLLFDFNPVITNLNKLPTEKALTLVETLRQSISASAEESEGYARAYPSLPLVGQTIFRQQALLYRALLEWLDTFAAQLREAAEHGK